MGKRTRPKFKPSDGLPVARTGIATGFVGANGEQTIKYLSPKKPKPAVSSTHEEPKLPSLLSVAQASEATRAQEGLNEAVESSEKGTASDKAHVVESCADESKKCGGKAKVNNTTPPHVTTTNFLTRWAQRFLNIMRTRESDTRLGSPCARCSRNDKDSEAIYRCMECRQSRLLCKACTVDAHANQPFHIIRRWNGQYFEKVTLDTLGYIFRLGHEGDPCPVLSKLRQATEIRNITVVHTTGLQTVRVQYCECPDLEEGSVHPKERPLQLWSEDLWPATYDRISTAFTHESLHTFHHLTMQSKISAYDYVKHLERLSPNLLAADVKDRYREFMTANRQYTYLRKLKLFGLDAVEKLKEACMAVLCPACPQPDINMDPNWEARPPEEWYIDALQYAKDGNFNLNQHAKKMDLNDLPMSDGAEYYVGLQPYEQFVELSQNEPECVEPTTSCSEFVAGGERYSGKRRSGQVGLNCTRHGFVLGCGTVNLTKGERYGNVDYATVSALRRWMKLRLFIESYDISCKYGVNWLPRLRSMAKFVSDGFVATLWPLIRRCVPKFHIPAHTGICRWLNSFWFMPGVGMTDGESPERRWSVLNLLGRAIREMGIGHRIDTLNTHFADYNMQKVLGIVKHTKRKYDEAIRWAPKRQEELASLEESLLEKGLPIPTWKAMEKEHISAVELGDPNKSILRSPYEPMEEDAPTTKEVLQELVREDSGQRKKRSHEEMSTTVSERMIPGRAVALKEALDLEDEQMELRKKVQKHNESHKDDDLNDEIEDARRKLSRKLDAWHVSYMCVIGQVLGDLKDKFSELAWPERNEDMPEVEVLPIPSNLPQQLRAYGDTDIKYMASAELRLRQGQANELLSELRNKLGLTSFLWKKTAGEFGQAAKTRNAKAISTVRERIHEIRGEYNELRKRLITLGEPNNSQNYPPLTEKDCQPLVIEHAQEKPGQTRKKEQILSWLWKDGKYVQDMNKWQIEASRIAWFRASALATRWQEELRITEEEMRRIQRFFDHYKRWWREKSQEVASNSLARGTVAFAARQSAFYDKLLQQALETFPKDVHVVTR